MENEKRLIDANKISYHKSGFPKGDDYDSRLDWAFRKDIDKLPTVDAVEVVRCKGCRHSKLPAVLTQKYGEPGTLTCHNWHSPCNKRNVKQDDFCSYGERRTNV